MHDMISFRELLLNVLIVTMPMFVYQIFWVKTGGKFSMRDKAIVGLCSTVSLLLCMTYPITCSSGYRFDLRILPVILSFLYGGRIAGIIVICLLILYRFTMGGNGFYYVLAMNTMLSAILYFVVPRFQLYSRKEKLRFSVGFSLICSVVFVVTLMLLKSASGMPFDRNFVIFIALYMAVHGLTAWLSIYLIEDLRENIRIRENVQRSEKLQVLSELSASVAHEIRNPMTTARGFMQLLKQQRHLDEQKKVHYIEMVIGEMDRAQLIITDFLAFAKPQAEKTEVLDVSRLIQQAIEIITPYALMKNVEVLPLSAANARVCVNKEKFIQCLVNILKNAVESIHSGEGIIQIESAIADGQVQIRVTDNGIGMTQEEIKRLGEPFYSTKEKGTGLGMMLCYRIVESFKGRISIESKKGKGTRLDIILPLAD